MHISIIPLLAPARAGTRVKNTAFSTFLWRNCQCTCNRALAFEYVLIVMLNIYNFNHTYLIFITMAYKHTDLNVHNDANTALFQLITDSSIKVVLLDRKKFSDCFFFETINKFDT